MEDQGTGATSADTPRARSLARDDSEATTATVTAVHPGAPAPATTGAGHTSTQGGVTTPKEAIEADEVHRMRVFFSFCASLAIVVLALVLLLPGDRIAGIILGLCAAATSLCASALLWVIRDPSRYRTWHTVLIGQVGATTVVAACYYFGVLSAVLLIIPIGTYFFALGRSFATCLSIHLNVTLGHLVLSLLQFTGVLDDVGILRTVELGLPYMVGMLFVVHFVFAAAFVMARGLRRATFGVMEQLDAAVRDNAQREALLNEAKQDLAWALRVGGPGRYSEQTVGSFKLGSVIGRGAMGEVYEAVHTKTGEPAAVKLLGQDAMLRPDVVSRFLREVKIAASLEVDNVVRVIEVPDPLDPLPYLAMERLHGETLADRLRREPIMPVPEVAILMHQLSRGIGAAHAAGIVHRDLKPRNVFRQRGDSPVWKILDFGVSKLADHGGTLTRGHVVGTPAYMAPEQARSLDVDARADLYALGVIGYRVLTGRPAFSGKDVPSILRSVVYDTPPRPSEIAPVPAEFDYVLAIAMAKDPGDRFADADELWRGFEAAELGTLGDELRRRGAAVMAKHPWGKRDVA